MSTLRVDTIQNAAGTDSPISVPGTAKAWVNFNGIGTVAIRASYNVSSITDNGTGNYTVNFTTAMPDTNYTTAFGGGSQIPGNAYYAMEQHDSPLRTTSAVKIYAVNGSVTAGDAGIVCVHIFR